MSCSSSFSGETTTFPVVSSSSPSYSSDSAVALALITTSPKTLEETTQNPINSSSSKKRKFKKIRRCPLPQNNCNVNNNAQPPASYPYPSSTSTPPPPPKAQVPKTLENPNNKEDETTPSSQSPSISTYHNPKFLPPFSSSSPFTFSCQAIPNPFSASTCTTFSPFSLPFARTTCTSTTGLVTPSPSLGFPNTISTTTIPSSSSTNTIFHNPNTTTTIPFSSFSSFALSFPSSSVPAFVAFPSSIPSPDTTYSTTTVTPTSSVASLSPTPSPSLPFTQTTSTTIASSTATPSTFSDGLKPSLFTAFSTSPISFSGSSIHTFGGITSASSPSSIPSPPLGFAKTTDTTIASSSAVASLSNAATDLSSVQTHNIFPKPKQTRKTVNLKMINLAVSNAHSELVSAGESVSVSKVSQIALETLQADSWDSLGFSMDRLPCFKHLKHTERKNPGNNSSSKKRKVKKIRRCPPLRCNTWYPPSQHNYNINNNAQPPAPYPYPSSISRPFPPPKAQAPKTLENPNNKEDETTPSSQSPLISTYHNPKFLPPFSSTSPFTFSCQAIPNPFSTSPISASTCTTFSPSSLPFAETTCTSTTGLVTPSPSLGFPNTISTTTIPSSSSTNHVSCVQNNTIFHNPNTNTTIPFSSFSGFSFSFPSSSFPTFVASPSLIPSPDTTCTTTTVTPTSDVASPISILSPSLSLTETTCTTTTGVASTSSVASLSSTPSPSLPPFTKTTSTNIASSTATPSTFSYGLKPSLSPAFFTSPISFSSSSIHTFGGITSASSPSSVPSPPLGFAKTIDTTIASSSAAVSLSNAATNLSSVQTNNIFPKLNINNTTPPSPKQTRKMVNLKMINLAVSNAHSELVSAGENVSVSKVSQIALETLQADSWDSLGFSMDRLPCFKHLKHTERKVNTLINCFANVWNISSLYDLEVQICSNQGVKKFEELQLGPLLRHPLVVHYFCIPSDGKEIYKITSQQLISYLVAYMECCKEEDSIIINSEKFLDFVAMEEVVPCTELLCLRRVQKLVYP